MHLPKRLEAVADQVIPGEVVADVGTGHGLLALALVERRVCPRVIATEVAEGPGEYAARLLADAGERRVEVRRGWGLEPLELGEASVLVIAGMGGATIISVLERGATVAASARRLILQPQNRVAEVRRSLLTRGFVLQAEDLVEEGGRFYPILVAGPAARATGALSGTRLEEPALESGTNNDAEGLMPVQNETFLPDHLSAFGRVRGLPPVPGEFLLEVGPLLAAGRHPVLGRQLQRRLSGAAALAETLAAQVGHRAQAQARNVRAEMAWLEMMLEWLRPSAR